MQRGSHLCLLLRNGFKVKTGPKPRVSPQVSAFFSDSDYLFSDSEKTQVLRLISNLEVHTLEKGMKIDIPVEMLLLELFKIKTKSRLS